MSTKTQATIDDLMRFDGKAELVSGAIVPMTATGWASNFAAGEIFFSLKSYVRTSGKGMVATDNAAFRVFLPHRESFSPDVAYYEGTNPGMKFFTGAPRFAGEVRSLGDYGPAADREIAAKRADYFAAGTLVVWDVDIVGEDVVKVYRATDPVNPTVYRRGQIAEAEPAVPGWTMAVDSLFKP